MLMIINLMWYILLRERIAGDKHLEDGICHLLMNVINYTFKILNQIISVSWDGLKTQVNIYM